MLWIGNTPIFASPSPWAALFMFFYNVSNGIFSALGDSRTPFLFLAASSTANIALDILFVAKFDMGVVGVGLATFICQGAACIPELVVTALKMKSLPAGNVPFFTFAMLREFISVALVLSPVALTG